MRQLVYWHSMIRSRTRPCIKKRVGRGESEDPAAGPVLSKVRGFYGITFTAGQRDTFIVLWPGNSDCVS